MGSNINNDFLKNLQETVMDNSWMSELYGSQRAEQQAKLKAVFTVVAENNLDGNQKKALEAQAESLQEKVERLEAKMAVLEEELAKNQEEIAKHANEITDLISQADNASDKLEAKQKDRVKDAVDDVFRELQTGTVAKDDVVPEIRRRIKDDTILKKYGGAVEKIIGQLDAKQAEVASLVASADKWIDQKKLLEAQYGATKSTYDLLNASIKKIGVNESSYTNSDFNKAVPVYSPQKADIVSKYSEDASINVPAGKNPNYNKDSQAPNLGSLANIQEKYKDLLNPPLTGADGCSIDNKAVVSLGKALDMGLIEDLTASGLSAGQLSQFIADNFSNAIIRKQGDRLSIPYGHDAKSRAIFTKLTEKIKAYDSSYEGAANTWDEYGGNTISSNKNIESLSQNFEKILDEMGNSEPKFTFKEAMYALFDPDCGIFKESGVSYNVDKQGEIPNYFIEFAGDAQTAQMYKNLSDKIFNIWGVKPSRGADVERYNDDTNNDIGDDIPDANPAPSVIQRTDPIWFNIGENKNEKFSFVIDRNKDGSFTDASEFVGGSKDSTWLDDLKSLDKDGDGKLTGDELKELKILGTEYKDNDSVVKDNHAFSPKKAESSKAYDRQETTKIEYTVSNAQSMGIEEINLADLESQVNQSTNIFDINGSEKFSDSFTFKMNGQEVSAHRQDETQSFMDAVYGDVYGKGFNIGFSNGQVDDVLTKDYGEFDKFSAKYSGIFNDINILKNVGNIAQETKMMYQDTIKRIQENESVELIKAGNRAAATKTVSGWSELSQEVQRIAARDGLVIDMNQAKGIYVLDGSLNAQAIVNKYKEQLGRENDLVENRAIQKEAFKAIILTAQAGVAASADEIKELLKSGKAKNAQEVAEILKEKVPQGVEVKHTAIEIGFDSEREEEIFNAFNKVFNEAGLNDKVVDALAQLCVEQQNNNNFMIDKTGEQLAKDFLKKYQG